MERHAALVLQVIGAQQLGLHWEGAQAATHDVTLLADNRLRSSSDSIAATGLKTQRWRLEAANIDFVKR